MPPKKAAKAEPKAEAPKAAAKVEAKKAAEEPKAAKKAPKAEAAPVAATPAPAAEPKAAAAAPAKAAPKAEAKKAGGNKKDDKKGDNTPKESLKDKGNRAFEQQEYPKALEFYTKAIEADEKNHVLYSNRSATYAALKNYPKALEDAETVIKLNSTWPKGHFRKGAALEALLRYPEAYQAYQAGLAIEANDAGLKKAASDLKEVMDELKMGAESKQTDSTENPDVDKFDAMCNWLRDGGGLFPKLYLMYYSEDYRGVHCLTKVPADEVILYVPLKHIMTSEVAKSSDIGKKIIASGVELRSTHSYLAAYLLQEKHKKSKSFWEPYLRILPVHYHNMPLSFDEEQLAWLKGSMCLQKIADRIDSLRREYENIRRHVPEFGKFTLDEFVWARLVVITRIFGLVIEGNKTDGLVPYADMLNHKKPREVAGGKDECETKWTFDDSRNGFIITSLKTIQRGDQVYDSYGRKCNSRFFVNYGFALDENTEDNESMLRVSIPPNDPHYHMKLRYLGGREHSARREFQVPASYREKKTKELFSFLRFVHAQDSELLMVTQSGDGFKLEDIEPISVRNEIKVLEDLKRAASERLSHFPDTLEHDLKLLASNTLEMYSNYRNSVVMRRGEKEVLNWFVELADKMIPYLKMPWKDVRKISAKSAQGTSTFDAYVTMVVAPLVKKNN